MSETKTAARLEQMLEEHRELRARIAEIERLLGGPGRRVDRTGGPAWAEALSRQLERLQAMIAAHFREEEESGFMESLLQEAPHLARRIARLKDQHGQILGRIEETRGAARRCQRGDVREDPLLWHRAKEVLDLIARHEMTETDIIQGVYSVDLGSGD